jgi:enoyl-CoA hydratase/carnithine racemase
MLRRSGHHVVELCLDSPSTRNALGLRELESLSSSLDAIARDPVARVVLFRSTGRVFSSGANRAEMADRAIVDRSVELLRRVIEQIAVLDQPFVCRVQGDAYGGALAVIAASDLAIASDRACFALPETRFGLVATVAAATCVPRLGLTAALDLMLTGRRFNAKEAAAAGLIASAVHDDALDTALGQRIDDLLLAAPVATAVSKRVARALAGSFVGHDLQLALALGRASSSEEARIGSATSGEQAEWVTHWHINSGTAS